MLQSPPAQQLMLPSPGQQFTLSSPGQQFNLAQFPTPGPALGQLTASQHILTQGHGGNVILQGQIPGHLQGQIQGQNSGMIMQGDNFLSPGLNQGLFVQNPVLQNINQQLYASAPNVINSSQIQGLFSQSQLLTNQNVGLISINQSPPGKGFDNQMEKMEGFNSNVGIINQQMQLLAQIAQQSSSGGFQQPTVMSNMVKPGHQTLNILHQSASIPSNMNQNQSLPSFGHFLLHHHMQGLPHPFLQNLTIASPVNTVSPKSDNSFPVSTQLTLVSPTEVTNLNAQFNSWNKGQLQDRARKQGAVTLATCVTSPVTLTSATSSTPGAKVILKTTTSVLPANISVSSTVKSCLPETNTVSNIQSVYVSTTMPQTTLVTTSTTTATTTAISMSAGVSVGASVPCGLLQPVVSVGQVEAPSGDGNIREHSPQTVTVPPGWTRVMEAGSIVYFR